MKIGIDLDEVLADFLSALIEYHNATYGTSLFKEQFQSYRFWEIWGGTKEEAIQKVYDFHQTSYFRNIKPVVGSQEATNILRQNNDLFVITSRQNDVSEATQKWVAQYFPNVFSDIFFTNHYSQNGSSTSTKKQICDSVGVDILIEDEPERVSECLNPKRKNLLFDHPWNRNAELPQEIYRVHSWKEILNFIQ